MDLVHQKRLLGRDLNEKELLLKIKGQRTKLIVTPVGGQGFVFGRGNQQLSPRVLTQVDRKDIHIVATQQKIHALRGRSLLIDTSDEETNQRLCGYYRIVTGYHQHIIYKMPN